MESMRCFGVVGRYFVAKRAFSTVKPQVTIQNVIDELYTQFGGQRVYNPKEYDRSDLLKILPKSQAELPPRRLETSNGEAFIPLRDDVGLRDKYINHTGFVRFGRILEDMDVFAVYVCHKYVMNPKKTTGPSPFCLVTALLDEIDVSRHTLKADENIKLSGQVSWVGRTSLESTLKLYQQRNDEWDEILKARFVMVARDPLNRGSAFVNPVLLETAEDKAIFEEGEINNQRRKQMADESLLKLPPTEEERALIHELFLKTLDTKAHSFSVRTKPENAQWMSEAKLKNVIICHPQERNVYNKIFGGFLMRQASELAWALGFLYSHVRPQIMRVDDIWFRKPVEIGSLLYLSSQVVYTCGSHMQIRVNASVVNPTTGSQETTNVFHFTFRSTSEEPVSTIVPKSYSEAMLYLDGKRHYDETIGNVGVNKHEL